MKDGYFRVAAASPRVSVADCAANARAVCDMADEAQHAAAALAVFPELCLTGYTCGDLFLHGTLLDAAEAALAKVVAHSRGLDVLLLVGLPVRRGGKLYNCAAAVHRGQLLGVVPKTFLPNYAEFYEQRHFVSGAGTSGAITLAGRQAPFGADLLFAAENLPGFTLGVEICEDLWVPIPPSCRMALAGATVIANLSASTQVAGKAPYLQSLAGTQSGRCICGYVYAGCGAGESSTDLVFSGQMLAAENGRILQKQQGHTGLLTADLDLQLIEEERRRSTSFLPEGAERFRTVPLRVTPVNYPALCRRLERHPFVPPEGALYRERCKEVLDIQTAGLAARLAYTHAKTAVVAVSGGLDSTLALLVAHRAIQSAGLSCTITAITMPGPGTTGRTRGNAGTLCEGLGAALREIPIGNAVAGHLADIGHGGAPDTAYENAQARERMQIAMDVANMEGGIVVGTGDMSELALGFTTYNGDHMSMYGVNAGVPKTLVRHLIRYVADENAENTLLRDTLYDILDTPVSPELLPAQGDGIVQKTEQIVGPYELHDFFLYYFLRFGFSPAKILRLANIAFVGAYSPEEIENRLREFLRRFFGAQFKRSCLPDGPKVGSVALSPRGDWRMPSDAAARVWLDNLEKAAHAEKR